jgi:hypothetical protein
MMMMIMKIDDDEEEKEEEYKDNIDDDDVNFFIFFYFCLPGRCVHWFASGVMRCSLESSMGGTWTFSSSSA